MMSSELKGTQWLISVMLVDAAVNILLIHLNSLLRQERLKT